LKVWDMQDMQDMNSVMLIMSKRRSHSPFDESGRWV
jgi:hypothetical protein